METGLAGKTVLVTGGSAGIGKAVSRAFFHERARVIVVSRDAQKLIAAAKEIGEIVCLRGDVRRDAAKILGRLDRLDVLVNNAGGMEHFERFEKTSARTWRSAYELNVVSAVEMSRAALTLLRRSGGSILNMASEVGKEPFRTGPDYCAAKAALLNFTKSLADELAPDVRVNALCVGPVVTDSWWQEADWHADRLRRLARKAAMRVPMGRIGLPEDVAGLAVFLASRQAAWITGAAFSVDGGARRSI